MTGIHVALPKPAPDPERRKQPGVRAWQDRGLVYLQLIVPRPWWAFWRPRSMRVWLSPNQAVNLSGTVRGLAEAARNVRARRG